MAGKGIRAPQQERSRRTVESIVNAARSLLETRYFESHTLQAIVQEAGCTVGAFYHLYDNKTALLHHLEDLFHSEANRILDGIDSEPATATGKEILTRAATEITGLYFGSRGVLRALVLESASDPRLRGRMTRRSRAVADRIAELVAARMEIARPKPHEAVVFALGAARALLREAVLFNDCSVLGLPMEREELISEVTHLVLGHLTTPTGKTG